MTVLRQNELGRRAIREIRWLAALEKELRRRVGWVDEAVSPFAGRRRTESTPANRPQPVLRGDKAA